MDIIAFINLNIMAPMSYEGGRFLLHIQLGGQPWLAIPFPLLELPYVVELL